MLVVVLGQRCLNAAARPFFLINGCWGAPCVPGEALTALVLRRGRGDLLAFEPTRSAVLLSLCAIAPVDGCLVCQGWGGPGATLRSMVVFSPCVRVFRVIQVINRGSLVIRR